VEELPIQIHKLITDIALKQRSSPGLAEEEAIALCREIAPFTNKVEHDFQAFLENHLPREEHFEGLRCSHGVLFDAGTCIPALPAWEATPIQTRKRIAIPKPDFAYGYAKEVMDKFQQAAAGHVDESAGRVSHPVRDVWWPFLVLEAKSQLSGGTHWAADNQCAGSGASLVRAVESLQRAACSTSDVPVLAFSVSVDAAMATLHVHWHNPDAVDQQWVMQQIESYMLSRPAEVKKFLSHTKNIIEWGMKSRLDDIKSALDAVLGNVTSREASAAVAAVAAAVAGTQPAEFRHIQSGRGATSTSANSNSNVGPSELGSQQNIPNSVSALEPHQLCAPLTPPESLSHTADRPPKRQKTT